MGKAFVDKSKPTVTDFGLYQRRLGNLLPLRFHPYVLRSFAENRREDMTQRPSTFNAILSHWFDGIRLGRGRSIFSRFEEDSDMGQSSQPSDVRIIPIKVQSHDDGKDTKCQMKNKDMPIILDDDVQEIIDITGDSSVSDSAKTRISFSARSSSADERTAVESKVVDKKKTQSPIKLDDEDPTASIHQSGFSKFNSKCSPQKSNVKCPSQPSEEDIQEVILVDGFHSAVTEHSSEKPKLDSVSLQTKGNHPSQNSANKNNNGNLVSSMATHRSSIFNNQTSVKFEELEFDVETLEDMPSPSWPVYEMLTVKLTQENRRINYVTGDGNCFFRALSKILYGCEKYHKAVRQLVIDIIATNKSKFAQFIDGDVQEHVEEMSQDHCWATTCEIYAAATVLQRDIFMLTPDHQNKNYSWLLFKPVFEIPHEQTGFKRHPCYITLCNTNGNHYDEVVADHGDCNCALPPPELGGISTSIDLT